MLIYTVGHSTRTQEELIELLRAYGVALLCDIRAIPYSRYNPQHNRETLLDLLPAHGIAYTHREELGGRRPPREVMERARSCSERSRGFAEYMKTPPFIKGLDRVLEQAEHRLTALMCGEIDPTHCHRFLVADALVARGHDVRHIISLDECRDHPVTLFSMM